MKKSLLLLTGLLVAAGYVFAETDYKDVSITTHKVTDHIYMLEGEGGNIGISTGEDGVLMIDTQFAPLADKIRAAVRELSDKDIKYVINTHYHHDHTDGNKAFGAEAVVIAHENVRDSLEKGRTVEMFQREIPPQPKAALPDITFEDSLSVHVNGNEVLVMYFPNSHTDTDSVVFFLDENVVHTGDLLFNGMYPFVDIPGGGSVQGLIANLDVILDLIDEDTKIIPGHGPLAEWQDLKDFRDMLVETSDIVHERIQKWMSLDEIKAAGLPEEIVERWGNGFLNTEQWIGILHASLLQ